MEDYLQMCASLHREETLIIKKMESFARHNSEYHQIWTCYDNILNKLIKEKRFHWKKHCALVKKLDAARRCISTTAGADIQDIRSTIFVFENELSAYKEAMANDYISLTEQSDVLVSEVDALDSLLTMHVSHATPAEKQMSKVQAERISERNEDIETHQRKVGALNKKIRAVELNNRWDTYEHDMLLRVWTQCVTTLPLTNAVQHKLIKKLSPLLPHKSVDDLFEHIIWYEELNALQQEKKQLVASWRESRFHTKGAQVDEIAEEVVPALTSPASNPTGNNNEDVKEKLQQWREAKERELAAQQAQKEQLRKEDEAKEKLKLLQRQRKSKILLQQWKESKEQQNDTSTVTSDSGNTARHKSPKTDPKALRERYEKDLQKVQERNKAIEDMARRKNRNSTIKEYADSQHIGEQYNNVTSRVLNATHAHKTRAISAEERIENEKLRRNVAGHEARIPMSGYDLRLGGRAAPMWTKGARL